MKGTTTIVFLAFASLALAAPDPRFPRTGKEWTPESLINPEELGDYFEGDIELPLPPLGKNGLINEKYHWPNGQVAYTLHSNFSEENKAAVKRAMEEYEIRTGGCITFRERTDEKDYICITQNNDKGCHSYIGKHGGKQTINYPQWCLNKLGSILHEMLHALGFHHEQSRSDRDDYVTIMWDNIEAGREGNFKKYPNTTVSGFGEEYDYGSVLHYSAYAFSSTGEKTIVTKDPNASIGQRDGLSDVDLRKLMTMYKC